MSDWYYAHQGQQKGPVPVSELERLAANGDFDPENDLIWKEGMDDWKPASTVAGFPLAKSPATQAPPADADSAAADPYASPSSGYDDASPLAGADLPAVKPANFGLFAFFTIVGTLGMTIGYGMMFAELFTTVANEAGATNGEAPAVLAPEELGLPMAIVGLSLIPMLIGVILGIVYLYRGWVLLQPHTAVSTPGKAVGYLFIPLFNLYWVFIAYWRWSQEWNRLVAASPSHPQAPRAGEGLFLGYAILSISGVLLGVFSLIPLLIVQLMMMKNLCNIVNYGARSGNAGEA